MSLTRFQWERWHDLNSINVFLQFYVLFSFLFYIEQNTRFEFQLWHSTTKLHLTKLPLKPMPILKHKQRRRFEMVKFSLSLMGKLLWMSVVNGIYSVPGTKFVCWRLISKYYLSKWITKWRKKKLRLFNRQFYLMPTRRSTVKHYISAIQFVTLPHQTQLFHVFLSTTDRTGCWVNVCNCVGLHMSTDEFTNVRSNQSKLSV